MACLTLSVSVELEYWVRAMGCVCKRGCVGVGVYGEIRGERERALERESSGEMGIERGIQADSFPNRA